MDEELLNLEAEFTALENLISAEEKENNPELAEYFALIRELITYG